MQIGDFIIIRDFITDKVLLSGRIVNSTDNPRGISLSSNKLLFINPDSTKLSFEKCDFVNDNDWISAYLDKQQTYIFYKHNNIDNTFDYDFFMWDEIEPEVKEICELLNQIPGIETYSSCSGHGIIPPWVDFYIWNWSNFFNLLDFLRNNKQGSKTFKHNEIESTHRFIVGVEGKSTVHLESLEINSNFSELCKVLKRYLKKVEIT